MAQDNDRPGSIAAPEKRSHQGEHLALRLDDGYRRISDSLADGGDIQAWEEFWIALLAEYEALLDESDHAIAA